MHGCLLRLTLSEACDQHMCGCLGKVPPDRSQSCDRLHNPTIIAGGAIAWSLKKQQTVALFTAEAKYIAATCVTKYYGTAHYIWN